jgi:hypothetical protein
MEDLVRWRKSSYSANGGECVETGNGGDHVLVRDSKRGDQSPVLTFSTDAWERFTDQIKNAG